MEKVFRDYNDLFKLKDSGIVDICTKILMHEHITYDTAKARVCDSIVFYSLKKLGDGIG